MSEKKEILFAKKLQELRELAKQQSNMVSEEQIQEGFESLGLEEEQLELVRNYLKENNIGIGEAPNMEEVLSEEERNYLQDYLDELALLPNYTDGQIQATSIAAMAGEKDAKELLVTMYLREVADVAKLYAGQGVLLEDLIGEGNLALTIAVDFLGALEKPEECAGALMQQVMNAMEQLIEEAQENEKIAKKAEDRVNKVNDKANELSEMYGRKITPEEVREMFGLSEKEIQDALRICGDAIEQIFKGDEA